MVAPNPYLPDEGATLALGAALAACLVPGLSIHLRGDLGAGKTTLVRGVLRGLGWSGRVRSPTYALVEVYEVSRLHLHHFDFYRFHDPREWIDAGFRDSFGGEVVTLVEWPDRAAGLLPPADLVVALQPEGEGRRATLASQSLSGASCLECLASRIASTAPSR